jgi:hypothetical protein
MFLLKLQVIAVLALAAARFAQAGSITTYNLSGNMDNGGIAITVAGQFNYDTTAGAVTDWELTISGPISAPFCANASSSSCYIFQPGGGATAEFTVADEFVFTSPNVGGHIDYLFAVPLYAGPAPLPDGTYLLDAASELVTTGPGGTGQAPFTSGSLVAVSLSTSAPEPATLVLFIAPLTFWGLRNRLRWRYSFIGNR